VSFIGLLNDLGREPCASADSVDEVMQTGGKRALEQNPILFGKLGHRYLVEGVEAVTHRHRDDHPLASDFPEKDLWTSSGPPEDGELDLRTSERLDLLARCHLM